MKVAVVIPFFQKEDGILTRALTSIANQILLSDTTIDVFITDDESPISALIEVNRFSCPKFMRIHVKMQVNKGPSSARNTCLKSIEDFGSFKYVAFLDSDDVWRPNHIQSAIRVMEAGYDLYFCDNERPGFHKSQSEVASILSNGGQALKGISIPIDKQGLIRGFEAHTLNLYFVDQMICHTSCAVARQSFISGYRFEDKLRFAGEDWMYWMSIFLRGARVSLSWQKNVECGTGINIFFKNFDWDSPNALNRLGNMLLFRIKLQKLLISNLSLTKKNNKQKKISARIYSYVLFRSLLKLKPVNWNLLFHILFLMPEFIIKMPFYLFSFSKTKY